MKNLDKPAKNVFEDLFKIEITHLDYDNCHIILLDHDEYVNFVLFKILVEPYVDFGYKVRKNFY